MKKQINKILVLSFITYIVYQIKIFLADTPNSPNRNSCLKDHIIFDFVAVTNK